MYLGLDGEGPLYRQLTRALKAAVLDGRLKAGARLPATRALSQELGLSRNTVRLAYDQLTAEGFFHGRSGAGSFVTLTPVVPTRNKPVATVAPQSQFARRARAIKNFGVGRLHRGLRYNLQSGEPIHDPTAITAWQRELARAALHTSTNYPDTQGLPALREAICDYLVRRRGMSCTPDDVVVVHGTQQAMALATQVLVDPGDCVVLEDPHYQSVRQVVDVYGADVEAIATDADGLACSELEAVNPKLIFVTPSHQFPRGSLMSMARRIELLNYADRRQCWIFEDDYDSEFRYDVHPLPALSALDAADRVIYSGTFSKVLFPSLRLGYLVVPAALRRDFVRAKYLSDMGCASIIQTAMAHYMQSGGFERHLRRVVQIGRARREALIKGLQRVGKGYFDVNDSAAGMHLVAWMPKMTHAQCDQLIEIAASHDLGLHPISRLYKKPPKVPGFLLGFAALSVTEIGAAMTVLEKSLGEWEKRQGPAHRKSARRE